VDSHAQEVSLKIFSCLNSNELRECRRVSKAWKVLASDKALWKAFDKKQWETYFGDIGKEPPLPKDIHKILKSQCPFWPEKKVGETHMLVLIPETVNGKPLNLKTLEELVKAPKKGHATKYQWKTSNEHENQAAAKSHWALMAMDIVGGDEKYTDQQALIARLVKQTGIDYEVPSVSDAAICIFTKYVSSGKCLFMRNSTRCQEKTLGGDQLAVGFYSPLLGLSVENTLFDGIHVDLGIAPLRKFF